MDDSVRSGPVDSGQTTPVPIQLIRRLVTSHATTQEYQVVLIIALITRPSSGPDLPVSEDALIRHELAAFAGTAEGIPIQDDSWIWQSLELALLHDLLIKFVTITGDVERSWYLLNTIENARFLSSMISGSVSVPESLWISDVAPRIAVDRPTVFRLYEQNVGPLTPLLAERLIRATERYPVDWIESAISESVTYNRRNWRYIERILENWAAEGLPTSTGPR